MTIKQFILKSALWLSAFWDLVTTFLGTLLILGSRGFVQIGISLVGTLIVGAFSFSTKSIWKMSLNRQSEVMTYVLARFIWILVICFDFFTSLTCNATYVAYQGINIGQGPIEFLDILRNLNDSQVLVVLFITILVTASPIILSYLSDRDIDVLGQ